MPSHSHRSDNPSPSRNPANRLQGVTPEAVEGAREVVTEHPFAVTLAAFGAGLGLGLALAFLLTDDPRQRQAGTAQRLGRQVLDALSSVVPSQLRS
jgi:hypothetical protein